MQTFQRGSVAPTAVVADDAELGVGVTIGHFTVVHPGVSLGDGCVVGSHCVLGEPTADFYGGASEDPVAATTIGPGAVVRSHSVVYRGVTIGADLRTGHRVTVREDCTIGTDVQLGTGVDLQGDLVLGDHVRLHSGVFVARSSTVEDFVWLFPSVRLVDDPHPPSDSCTHGPTVRRYAAVGAGATVMPGIEVGEHAVVGAASVVTRDVAAGDLVLGAPARVVGPASEVECRHGNLDRVYPWPVQFRRGYPEGALPPVADFEPLDG